MIRRVAWTPSDGESKLIEREWLVTNGRGGYASGTLSGAATRRYHGLLIAALPAPLGRVVMLNHLLERVRLPNRQVVWLGDEDAVAGPNSADRTEHLAEFRLALASDTVSIAIMEVVDNLLMLMVPGAMTATLLQVAFWAKLLFSLVIAGLAAYPANRWLIARGKGHAVMHQHMH